MFRSEKIACYLNTFGGHGDDADDKELKFVFHITPISPELALEISPLLADRLFRKEGGEFVPAAEMPKASFAKIPILMQNITFYESPDTHSGTFVPGASISNLRAARAFPEGPEFRLEFDVVLKMDDTTMTLAKRFYKGTCFLSMQEIQKTLEITVDEAHAENQQAFQDAADGAGEPEAVETGGGRRSRRGKSAAAAE